MLYCAVLQCDIKAPKQYMYRVLPDEYRMSAWWAATAAAVQAVQASGRSPRVLLLGARAGVLAAAALRAGAAHVTCVERWVDAATDNLLSLCTERVTSCCMDQDGVQPLASSTKCHGIAFNCGTVSSVVAYVHSCLGVGSTPHILYSLVRPWVIQNITNAAVVKCLYVPAAALTLQQPASRCCRTTASQQPPSA